MSGNPDDVPQLKLLTLGDSGKLFCWDFYRAFSELASATVVGFRCWQELAIVEMVRRDRKTGEGRSFYANHWN